MNYVLHEDAFNSNYIYSNKFKPEVSVDDKLKLLLSHSNYTNWNINFELDNTDILEETKQNFNYYTTEDFNKTKDTWNKETKFSLFHTNICSLNANIENMEDLLYDLGHRFDILAVTETWNQEKTNKSFSAKHIEGYQDYHGTTGSSLKGGCGIYVNDDLNSIPRKDLEYKINVNEEESESCWIEIINKKSANILVGVFYRHPSKQNSIFNESLETIFKKLRKEKKKTIICGDFNHNLLNYDKDKHVNTFLNTMLENNFQPLLLLNRLELQLPINHHLLTTYL